MDIQDEPSLGSMAQDLHGAPMPEDAPAPKPTRRVVSTNAKEKRKIKPATLQNSLRHQHDRKQAGKLYSEDMPAKVGAAVDSSSMLQTRLQSAGNLPPEKRAELGGAIGAHLGNKIAGPHGSLIGAAIGSDAVRSLGVAQSGEHALEQRQNQVFDIMRTVNLVDDSMVLRFKDGTEIDLSDPNTEMFPNTAPNIVGKASRSLFQLDPTNPFTSRAKVVAKMLSYYVVGALLKQSDFKDKMVLKTVDNTATMLVNAFETGVKDIASVYERAKEVVAKLGVTKAQLSQFFYDQRTAISSHDAADIKQGLSIVFGK